MRRLLLGLIVLIALAGPSAAEVDTSRAISRGRFDYYAADPVLLERASAALEAAAEHLARILGDSLSYRAKVYILDDHSQFEAVIGGRFPEWGAAAAVSARRLVAVKSPATNLTGKPMEQLLVHEYAHLLIDELTGQYEAPRWLHEGIAQYVSVEWSWTDNLAMGRAAVLGQFNRLAEMEKVNRFGQAQAELAYAQAYLAVWFLVSNYGAPRLQVLLGQIGQGAPLDSAMWAATGLTMAEFEEDFAGYLHSRYNLAGLFMDTFWIWLGLAVVVIVGAFIRYRRRREYYRRWEEQEKYESTDFEYGDPDRPEETDDDEPWRG